MENVQEEIQDNWKNGIGKTEKIILNMIAIGLSFLVTAPLFIIVYRYIPDMKISIGETFRLDHILTFSVLFIIFFTIFKLIKKVYLYSALTAFVIFLTVSQLSGKFGLSDMITKYKDMISYFEDNPVNIPFLADEKMTIRNAAEIRKAIDYNNPELRDFAVEISISNFSERKLYDMHKDLLRYFSVFKELNTWNYVHDPKGEDFFSKASISCKLLAGDCDDYSILMAACIKAIGGEPRLIHTENHIYPEVKVGTTRELPEIIELIKTDLFYKESLGKKVFYHLDNDGNVWLNFDYSGSYPGARFLHEKIIGILKI